jgi:hypothetical protein
MVDDPDLPNWRPAVFSNGTYFFSVLINQRLRIFAPADVRTIRANVIHNDDNGHLVI